MNGLTAVDYAMEYGSEAIGCILRSCGAVDGKGLDIFTRAVRDNNASFVQHLWQTGGPQKTMQETRQQNTKNKQLLMVESNEMAKATQCSCFVPHNQCDAGVVRYAVVFADTFPRV